MKLNKLELRNFKGIKNLTVTPEGENLNICGDNGTGKTTVFDSFMWLLFDKDSNNSSNFNIKTLDKDGLATSGPEYEVKGIIEIDGKEIELQKILKERWTKRRGESERTLTGNTTDYFIDGVPKLKKEYAKFLEEVIDEETFRILTNPLHFNTNLEWKKRRSIAMELVDEIENEDVFKVDERLLDLKELLAGDVTVEDLKAKKQSTKRKLNQEIKQIPVRIDEISRQNLDEDIDFDSLEKEKKKLEKKIEDSKVESIDTKQLEELKEEVAMLETWKRTFERDKTAELNEEYKEINKRLQDRQKLINDMELKHQKLSNEAELLSSKVTHKGEELEGLRVEYQNILKLEFNKNENTCTSCGQELQEDKKDKNSKRFENYRETQINENIEKGKTAKQDQEVLEDKLKDATRQLDEHFEEVKQVKKDTEEFEPEIERIEKQLEAIDFNKYEEYKDNSLKITRTNRKIESILTTSKDKTNEQQNRLKELEEELSSVIALLSNKKAIESNMKRVEELKEEERNLAEQIAKLEKIEMLCEDFIINKAELLEDKLNDKFDLVKFKLFNTLVNGGVDETFISTVDGVPFDDLNNAMKTNAGLDIINTLTKHFKFNPPIFIDNRESINKIIDIDSQIINLIVSDDKKLTVEDKKSKGVA